MHDLLNSGNFPKHLFMSFGFKVGDSVDNRIWEEREREEQRVRAPPRKQENRETQCISSFSDTSESPRSHKIHFLN